MLKISRYRSSYYSCCCSSIISRNVSNRFILMYFKDTESRVTKSKTHVVYSPELLLLTVRRVTIVYSLEVAALSRKLHSRRSLAKSELTPQPIGISLHYGHYYL